MSNEIFVFLIDVIIESNIVYYQQKHTLNFDRVRAFPVLQLSSFPAVFCFMCSIIHWATDIIWSLIPSTLCMPGCPDDLRDPNIPNEDEKQWLAAIGCYPPVPSDVMIFTPP